METYSQTQSQGKPPVPSKPDTATRGGDWTPHPLFVSDAGAVLKAKEVFLVFQNLAVPGLILRLRLDGRGGIHAYLTLPPAYDLLRLEGEDRDGMEIILGEATDSDVRDVLDVVNNTPRCRECGCTEERACEGGCYWVIEPAEDEAGRTLGLCSACDNLDEALDPVGTIGSLRGEVGPCNP